MRKFLLLMVGVGLLLAYGCKKDDTTGPVISLTGNSVMSVNFKTPFVDPGATAVDDEDGEVVVYVSGVVNTNLADTYILTYSAEDAAGNLADEVTRTVHVYLKGNNMAGAYAVSDSIPGSAAYNYQDNITASTLDSMKILVSKFAYYTNGGVYFKLTGNNGTSVSIPSQMVTCGNPAADRTFTGTGTITKDANFMQLNYSETTNGQTINGVEKYTRQ